MKFMDEIKNELNVTTTENGDKAYISTLSNNLDFFASAGSYRNNLDYLLSLFIKAYFENKKIALKNLFYLRDIRNGLGERDSFRKALRYLGNNKENDAKQLIKYVSEFGRYDDLLCLIGTKVEDEVVAYIKKQLDEDIENKKLNKNISLLPKWMPSINASNKEVRNKAIILASKLGYTKEEYRKILSFLRKGYIIENNLRVKDFTFEYDKVPGRAFNKYQHAFYKNDFLRMYSFQKEVMNGKKKAKVETVSPYEIVSKIRSGNAQSIDMLNLMFDSYKLELSNKKTLVVRDGSGSMYNAYNSPLPIDVADAFTILYSSKLEGEFKDTFISFSSRPRFIKLNATTLSDKLAELKAYNEIANTDIKKVYDCIFKIYSKKDFKKEDAIDRILIISDMEFDYCVENYNVSTFEYIKDKFNSIGYEMPEVVFLQVGKRTGSFPVKMDENGTVLISGSSKNVLDLINKTESINPVDFMNKVLDKYNFIDNLVLA